MGCYSLLLSGIKLRYYLFLYAQLTFFMKVLGLSLKLFGLSLGNNGAFGSIIFPRALIFWIPVTRTFWVILIAKISRFSFSFKMRSFTDLLLLKQLSLVQIYLFGCVYFESGFQSSAFVNVARRAFPHLLLDELDVAEVQTIVLAVGNFGKLFPLQEDARPFSAHFLFVIFLLVFVVYDVGLFRAAFGVENGRNSPAWKYDSG